MQEEVERLINLTETCLECYAICAKGTARAHIENIDDIDRDANLEQNYSGSLISTSAKPKKKGKTKLT